MCIFLGQVAVGMISDRNRDQVFEESDKVDAIHVESQVTRL